MSVEKVTVTTQPYVRVEGERKQMTHIDGNGTVRTLYVDVDFNQCTECGALLIQPGDPTTHERWHAAHRTAEPTSGGTP